VGEEEAKYNEAVWLHRNPERAAEERLRGYLEAALEGDYQNKKREDEVKSSMNRFDETGVIG
jgi:hypothetical protein